MKAVNTPGKQLKNSSKMIMKKPITCLPIAWSYFSSVKIINK